MLNKYSKEYNRVYSTGMQKRGGWGVTHPPTSPSKQPASPVK
jgi:hypothetical protein